MCASASSSDLPENSHLMFDQFKCTNCSPCGACGACGSCGTTGLAGVAGVEGLKYHALDLPCLSCVLMHVML